MGGQAVLDAEQLLQLGLHPEEGLTARIGVVCPQHGGLHIVAHGVDTGVRQHVHENIPVVELEGVETGGLDLLQTLIRRQKLQLLNDLDLVHLHGNGFVFVERNLCHFEYSYSFDFNFTLYNNITETLYTLTLYNL